MCFNDRFRNKRENMHGKMKRYLKHWALQFV